VRVLMPTPLYLPSLGGVERYVAAVARRLAKRGVFVTVLTTDRTGTLPPHEEDDGVQVLRVPAWPRRGDYLFAPDVYRIVARTSWDVVHVQSYHTLVAPLAMLGARRAGVPYLVTFHGGGHSSRVRRALRGAQWAALRPSLRRAERLVALARFEIDLYGRKLGVPPERFVHIPVGTDLRVTPSSPASRASKNGSLVASVGRLERYKGHHRLIEALPLILQEEPDARVWIAGSGPYEAELRRMASELDVADRVEIRAIPPDRRDDMAAELARASLLVLLSDYETQPAAVLEAVAQRIPALVTHNTGLAELADEGLARAIPTTSGPRQVAAAVLDQLRNPYIPERISLTSWDECTERHHELYLEIAAKTSRGAHRR
jgi:glycogen synthase